MLKLLAIGGAAAIAIGIVLLLGASEDAGPLAAIGIVCVIGGVETIHISILIWFYRGLIKDGGRRRTAILVLAFGGLLGGAIYDLVLERRKKRGN